YRRTRDIEDPARVRWGDIEVPFGVTRSVPYNPMDEIKEPWLREEARRLWEIADLVHSGRVRFVTSFEVRVEVWGQSGRRKPYGYTVFNAITVREIESPLQHSRVLVT